MWQFNGKQEGSVAVSDAPNLRCPRNGKQTGDVVPSHSLSFHLAATGGPVTPACWEGDEGCSVSPDTGQPGDGAFFGARCLNAQAPSGKAVRAYLLVFSMTVDCLRVPLAALPLAVATAFSLPAWAQTESAAVLPETVVTATRTATRTDALLSDVVLIEGKALAESGGRTLSEVLSRTAGLQISSNGGLGKQSGVFVRGTESRHVLLLVDGVRVGSSTAGTASFDNLPLASIERIEVLKGPASALYGSDAVGGVVQVFTRRGQPGLAPQATLSVGSFGHRGANAGLSGGTEGLRYALNAGSLDEKGFSATNARVPFDNFNPDRDGFKQNSGSASLSWAFAPGWSSQVNLSQANGDTQFDQGADPFDVRTEAVTRVATWGLERQWAPGVRTQVKLSRSDDLSATFDAPGSVSVFDTAQTQASVQQDWATAFGAVVLGAESIKEAVSGTQAYLVNNRTTRAVFAGLNGQAAGHVWQANLRRDRNSQFGSASTGVASYGYQVTPNWRPFLAYGTSFKAPSFNALYFDSPFFQGNPSTQPERGKNREFGLHFSQGLHNAKLTRFDNRIRGFITTDQVAANVPQVRIKGWSLGYSGAAGDWDWSTQLEQLDARNLSTGNQLARRADRNLSASLAHQAGAWNWGASVLALSDRFDDSANTDRLAGFATLDLHTRYRFSADWSLALRLNNVGDRAYETARGYNQAGRSALLTLEWKGAR